MALKSTEVQEFSGHTVRQMTDLQGAIKVKIVRRSLLILIAVVSIFVWIVAAEPEIQREYPSRENWPATVQEAVDDLLPRLYLSEKLMVMTTSEEDITSLHLGFGTMIRNRYGLWRGNEKLVLAACGWSCHPEDASMPIIRAVWQALHNCLSCLFPNGYRLKKIDEGAGDRRSKDSDAPSRAHQDWGSLSAAIALACLWRRAVRADS